MNREINYIFDEQLLNNDIMKKLLLFLLFTNLVTAQGIGIEIHLVNPNLVHLTGTIDPNDMYAPKTGTDDAGLNQILQQYGPCRLYSRDYFEGIVGIYCDNTNLDQFVIDLRSYSSVISYAHIMINDLYTDRLYTTLVDPNVGYSTDLINHSGITNDAGLNQIFQDFNVYYYARFITSLDGGFLRYYWLKCNCENTALKAALDNYTNVIYMTGFYSPAYLTNEKFNTKTYSITPNPFITTFNIQTIENITNYSIFDISGKQIINCKSKTELDNQVINLKSGIYMLKIEFENEKAFSQKLIKQ
jgi:hypothetical protein